MREAPTGIEPVYTALQAPGTGAAEGESALERDAGCDEMGSVSRSSGHGSGHVDDESDESDPSQERDGSRAVKSAGAMKESSLERPGHPAIARTAATSRGSRLADVDAARLWVVVPALLSVQRDRMGGDAARGCNVNGTARSVRDGQSTMA